MLVLYFSAQEGGVYKKPIYPRPNFAKNSLAISSPAKPLFVARYRPRLKLLGHISHSSLRLWQN